jgi:purine nucleosidase
VTKKIILDCDPGIDDALAIVYAAGSPELELLGITTVAGNVSLDKTTSNALRVCEFIGAVVPVTPGCAAPLLRPPITAEHVHGADGLRGARLPSASTLPRPGHASDFIIETVLGAPDDVTLIAIGPLTNVALALLREPRIAHQVHDFVIMGGSASRGNVTPAAEFNIACDPEAASIVFSAGWTVTMVGLDVTLQALADQEVIGRLGALGRLADALLLPCLGGYASAGGCGGSSPRASTASAGGCGGSSPRASTADNGSGFAAVHDLCAVAHVARPGLLGCQPARVDVETAGRWTSGMTVTDFRASPPECNARVATTIDVLAFWDAVMEVYRPVAESLTR